MIISGLIPFLILCLVISILLVRSFKYDLRFDRTIDPEYYANYPGISKTISIIKLIPRYIVLSTLLAWLISLLYNNVASKQGWTAYPNLTMADFKGFAFIKLDTFWYVAAASAGILAIWDMIRCGRTPLKEQRQWDVFISYKSEDVDLARRIADQLLASGLKVWFADYYVLLQNFDKFQEAIDTGIAHSNWGICLTNNRYIGSTYCSLEMKQLLDHLPPGNVLEIMIPKEDLPHQQFQALDNCPAYVGTDLPGIFSFIQRQTGWKLASILPEVINTEERTHTSMCMNHPVTLDITDWHVIHPGQTLNGTTDILKMEYIHRKDQYHILVNLVCGPEYAREGNRIGQKINDRQMFDLLRKHAEKHTSRLKAKIHGLHLVFHQGLSQFAITYRMPGYWTRKYSVSFPNPTSHQNAEFVFTFGFVGSFEHYCQNVHIMDRLVKSLQWT